jgi:predicted nucleotidyltransferase
LAPTGVGVSKKYTIAPKFLRLEPESGLKAIIPLLTEKFHVSSIGDFASYYAGQHNEKSDLDLLAEFPVPVASEFFTSERFLEQYMGILVELVTRNSWQVQFNPLIALEIWPLIFTRCSPNLGQEFHPENIPHA